jgi:hypothetical protein
MAPRQVLRAIQTELVKKPDRGAMVPGLGGVRKARLANPTRDKGECGGFRYLYLYLETKQHIHLLVLLDKNEQEDASEEQRKFGSWSRRSREHCEVEDGEENQSEHF